MVKVRQDLVPLYDLIFRILDKVQLVYINRSKSLKPYKSYLKLYIVP